MRRSSEGRKFKIKRRELVSYLRKNSSCLESLSPTEVLNKFVSEDDHLRMRLTQSLLNTGWLKKDPNSLLSFVDGELSTRLAVSTHTEKFGRTCPVCHKNYGRTDRMSQNTLVRNFGVCILCLAKGSDNPAGSSSQALAKILVSAAIEGFLLNGRNSFIRTIGDNDPLTQQAIERLAELFAKYSDAVSSVEIKESAMSMLRDLKLKEEKRAKHEQNRLTELAKAIAALGMAIDYDILDGTVYGKTYVIKIWIEGYGTTFIEGDKTYIVRTLSNIESKIRKARFKCPACEAEFKMDRSLSDLTICRCGTRFRFAQVCSSMYEGVNPQAAFDPWPWLIAGIKARIQKSSEMDIYFNLLHYGISVGDLFDGVYVTDVPLSDFPCYAISTFVRPKSFENLSPSVQHHLALAAMTKETSCQLISNFGKNRHIITYRLNGHDAYVDTERGDQGVGIYLIALSDSDVISWLHAAIADIERDDLDDWYFDERHRLEIELPEALTPFQRELGNSFLEGWGIFIRSEATDSLNILQDKIAAAARTISDKSQELLAIFSKRVRDIKA